MKKRMESMMKMLLVTVLTALFIHTLAGNNTAVHISPEGHRILNHSCFMVREGCNQMLYHGKELSKLKTFHEIEVYCSFMDLSCDSIIFEASNVEPRVIFVPDSDQQ